jgi:hypothetical protein
MPLLNDLTGKILAPECLFGEKKEYNVTDYQHFT